MSIFDIFSGESGRKAYKQSRADIQQGIGTGTADLNNFYGRAQSLLGTGRGGSALGAVDNAFNRANSVLAPSYQQAGKQLGAGAQNVLDAYGTGYRDSRDLMAGGFDQARDDITSGFGRADDFLTRLGGDLQGAIDAGGARSRGDLISGFKLADDRLGGAYRDTQGYLGQATAAYDPLVTQGKGALDRYMDAIGAAGAAGDARAQAGFKSSLGFNAGLNEGVDAVMRTAAARGQLGGGNTDRDLFDYGADFQNRQSQRYIDNLAGGANIYGQGVAGRAGALTAQADAAQNYGSAGSALAKDRGVALGALEQQLSGQRQDALSTTGQARASLEQQLAALRGGLSQGRGTTLAALADQFGMRRAGTFGELGHDRANLALNRGTGLGNLATNLGASRAGIFGQGAQGALGTGRSLADLQMQGMSANTAANNAYAKSQQDASGALWGGIFGLGNTLMGSAGQAGGFSKLFA